VCWRHGAYRSTHDESTAFGSEFDMTTATQTIPNHRAPRAAVREGKEGSSVPGEVTILCQEIVEVWCCTLLRGCVVLVYSKKYKQRTLMCRSTMV